MESKHFDTSMLITNCFSVRHSSSIKRNPSLALSAQTSLNPSTISTFFSWQIVFRTVKAAWRARPRSLCVSQEERNHMGRMLVMGRTPLKVPLSVFILGTNRRLATRVLLRFYA